MRARGLFFFFNLEKVTAEAQADCGSLFTLITAVLGGLYKIVTIGGGGFE